MIIPSKIGILKEQIMNLQLILYNTIDKIKK